MSDKEYDYSEYQEQPTSDDAMAELSRLVSRMAQEAQAVERLEEELKKAKKVHTETAEQAIPNLMDSLGITEFSTTEGFKIKIKESVHASINKDNSQAALAWVEAHGYGRMIKNQFTVTYPTDQGEIAEALRKYLEENHANYKQKESIHPSTLKAWARELLEEGKDIPLELIAVYRKRVAKVG
jgi:hypothetical protein